MILDSGNRTEFQTGAVRDMHEGKGRCDLLPLDVVCAVIGNCECVNVIKEIHAFQQSSNARHLKHAIVFFCEHRGWRITDMLLEVAKHFEEGAKKYGECNWQKGINLKCYIDSGIRHFLKWLRGDDDEQHDRAFCWNMMCALWTCMNKPELNDYIKTEGETNEQ